MDHKTEQPTEAPDCVVGTGQQFVSTLAQGAQRFLAHVIEHGLNAGQRTPDDFIRHFSPRDIMWGLEHRPQIRAAILEPTTGIKRRIALKKSAASSAEDLQIALDENETDAATILGLFAPDERVRHLDNNKLWAYIVEDQFWSTGPDRPQEHQRAKSLVAFILDRALTDELLTPRDIIEGLTVGELVKCLSRPKLASVLVQVLNEGHDNRPFADKELLAVIPPASLVDEIPLSQIWESVIRPKLTPVAAVDEAAAVPQHVQVEVMELVVDEFDEATDQFGLHEQASPTAVQRRAATGVKQPVPKTNRSTKRAVSPRINTTAPAT